MKKMVFVLAVLMFYFPARADVEITCAQVGDTNEVLISVTSTEPNLIRAFALDIKLTPYAGSKDPHILEVTALNPGYWVFPGTIRIDPDGNITNPGSPVAEYGDLPSDTLPGLDSNGVTVELASLYAPAIPDSPNAPVQNGPLLSISVSDFCCITFTPNVSRAGPTGVVMENPDEVPVVILPLPLCLGPPPPPPNCWLEYECAGQQLGDATCDGNINLADLLALKAAWGKAAPWTPPYCCSDFNHSDSVNLGDLLILKANWGITGLLPATKNQNCP